MNKRWHYEVLIYKPFTKGREAAYRRALKAVGFMPQTIDIIVERDREWIESGR